MIYTVDSFCNFVQTEQTATNQTNENHDALTGKLQQGYSEVQGPADLDAPLGANHVLVVHGRNASGVDSSQGGKLPMRLFLCPSIKAMVEAT